MPEACESAAGHQQCGGAGPSRASRESCWGGVLFAASSFVQAQVLLGFAGECGRSIEK